MRRGGSSLSPASTAANRKSITMTKQRRKTPRSEEEGESTMNRIQVGNIEAILKDGSTAFYGIEVPEGMTNEQAAETQEWHGPPVAEMFEDQERTLFPDWRTVTR